MSKKILIIGATGSVGKSLAEMIKNDKNEAHLVAKNKEEVSKLSQETGFKFTIADVQDPNFIEILE